MKATHMMLQLLKNLLIIVDSIKIKNYKINKE